MKQAKSGPLFWLGCGALALGVVLAGAVATLYDRRGWLAAVGALGMVFAMSGVHLIADAVRMERGQEPAGKQALGMALLQMAGLAAGLVLIFWGMTREGAVRAACMALGALVTALDFWLAYKTARK